VRSVAALARVGQAGGRAGIGAIGGEANDALPTGATMGTGGIRRVLHLDRDTVPRVEVGLARCHNDPRPVAGTRHGRLPVHVLGSSVRQDHDLCLLVPITAQLHAARRHLQPTGEGDDTRCGGRTW